MKLLWIVALSIISLTYVKSQSEIDGTWISDWQNQAISGCLPDNFTISGTGTTSAPYIIQYDWYVDLGFFSSCYQYNKGQLVSTSNLYPDTEPNTFYDSNANITFVYDSSSNTLSGTFYTQSKPFLFTSTGSSISQQAALGTLGRTWSNKSPSSENSGTCCVPDAIFVGLANPQFYLLAQFNAVYYYNTSKCAQTTTYTYQVSQANPNALYFTATNNDSIIYTPDDFEESWTFFLSANNGTCNYTYSPRAYNELSYTWYQDWQTTPDKFSPSRYSVTEEGYSPYYYLVSDIVINSTNSTSSFLVQTPEGLYFDPYLNMNGTYFSYDSPSETLLSVSTSPATEDALLLSPSGSLFSPSYFCSYWTYATPISSQSSIPSDCCVPSYIYITTNQTDPTILSVWYYFSEDMNDIEGCQDIQHSIYQNQLESTLSIKVPNITQVVWTDFYGHQISFETPYDTSTIQVSNFLGQCSFYMEVTSTPPPNPPSPSYSSVISVGIMTLISFLFIFNL